MKRANFPPSKARDLSSTLLLIFNFRADKSIYHALGLSTFSYLEAVMTFERVRLVTLHLDILHKV